MCQECRQNPCHSQCPNCKCHKIGNCENCGENLYEEYEIWTDNNGSRFCSKDCAIEFYGIKEIDC